MTRNGSLGKKCECYHSAMWPIYFNRLLSDDTHSIKDLLAMAEGLAHHSDLDSSSEEEDDKKKVDQMFISIFHLLKDSHKFLKPVLGSRHRKVLIIISQRTLDHWHSA